MGLFDNVKFDDCVFYLIDGDSDEALNHEHPEDAILDWCRRRYADHTEVPESLLVHGYMRVDVTPSFGEVAFDTNAADLLLNDVADCWMGNYGGDDGYGEWVTDDLISKLKEAVAPILQKHAESLDPWFCERVAKRSYSRGDVIDIWEEDELVGG